jgi:hypothetical protein
MGEREMIKNTTTMLVFFNKNNKKRKRANQTSIALFLISLLVIPSILLSGCVSENPTKAADVILTNMTHVETLQFPIGYKSNITFSLQNIGDASAKNITMRVIVHDNDGNEPFNSEESVISILDPNAVTPHKIILFYDLDDETLNLNITIRWDTGEHNYTRSFVPKIIDYANVQLDFMTHHERIEFPDIRISHVNFTLRNTGNMVAKDVKSNIVVQDEDNNEQYHQEVNVSTQLIPGEFISYGIDIVYDLDDILLNLTITIKWNTGENNYSRSFSPEVIEQANIQLENMTHFERYRLLLGHLSTVDFILQNRGNEIAEDVTIGVIAQDQSGNIQYTKESNVITELIPGAIVVHEISIPYDYDDIRLNLTINVKWTGGENQYTRSFTPELLL